MNTTKDRLEKGAALLELLDRRRKETRTPALGQNMEYCIVARELRELEANILADPGALESQLVRVRRRRP